MKQRTNGFTIIEVIATMVIIVIIMGGVAWNLLGIRYTAEIQQAVHRAALITTSKEVFYRELGHSGLSDYKEAKSDNDRFNLLKPYLPYIGEDTALSAYTPEGYRYSLNELHEKVGVLNLETKQKIEY